jgi:hypothetical protein
MSVVVAIATVAFITREESTPSPRPTHTPSPDFSLTDAEAIARLKELDLVARRAVRSRDESLVPLAFGDDSPAGSRAIRAVRRLIRDGVRDRTGVNSTALRLCGEQPKS